MTISKWRTKVANAEKTIREQNETKRLNKMPKHLRAKELAKKK